MSSLERIKSEKKIDTLPIVVRYFILFLCVTAHMYFFYL